MTVVPGFRLLFLRCLLVLLTAPLLAADEVVIMQTPVRVVTSSSVDIFPRSWHGEPVKASG